MDLRFERSAPAAGPAKAARRLYLGDDAAGAALEVLAVDLANGDLLVIHAMPLRDRFQELYKEAAKVAKVTARKGQAFVTKAGDVLTEQDIEALADEAEAGYDASELRPQRVGRPSLESGVSPRVSFRTSRKLYQAARERAEQEGRTLSDLAREAMERYVTDRSWDSARGHVIRVR